MADMEQPKKGSDGEQDLDGLKSPGQAEQRSEGNPRQEVREVWELIREAFSLPLDPKSPGTFQNRRDQRKELYLQVLKQTEVLKDDPDAGPFRLRDRVTAWLGLLADLAPSGEAGKIVREATDFDTYLLSAREDTHRLKLACERMVNSSITQGDKQFVNAMYESIDALVSRYENNQNDFDFTKEISHSVPDCIDKANLATYVEALRSLGCDRAKGWYVNGDGERHQLFSYDRMKDAVMVAMRSSGKAITGLVAVRLLNEYRTVRAQDKTLEEILDTPVLELCPKLRAQIEDTHREDSGSIQNWKKITFRQLITHTSGLPRGMDVPGDKLYEVLISLEPDAPREPGRYCNSGFNVVNLALEEIIESTEDGLLGAKSLEEFAATVMQSDGQAFNIPTLTIPTTPITQHPIPQGSGMCCSTLETWSCIPEVLKEQPREVVNELLEGRAVEIENASTPWKVGGGFWLEDYGLNTLGDLRNYSHIIPQEPKGERTHGDWISDSLKKGYIVIVRQADAPIVPCDFELTKKRAAESLLNKLFNQRRDSSA